MTENEEYMMKICLIGTHKDYQWDFISYFAETKIEKSESNIIGVDITTKKINIDNNQVKIILVSPAPQEFFGKLRPSYYRGASAAIITFDTSVRQSFDDIPAWKEEFRKYIPEPQPQYTWIQGHKEVIQSSVPIILVGITRKPSMHREPEIVVSTDEGQSLADKLDLKYFDVDLTKPGSGVQEIFHYLARIVIASK